MEIRLRRCTLFVPQQPARTRNAAIINPPAQFSVVLATKIAHTWHIASTRFAGQIWGTYRRIVNPMVGKVQRSFELPTHPQYPQP